MVVLVVCKTRLFVRKSSRVLETIPVSEKKQTSQLNNEQYTENSAKENIQVSEQDDHNLTNIDSVLPNRSPHLYERNERYRKSSKVYENIRI